MKNNKRSLLFSWAASLALLCFTLFSSQCTSTKIESTPTAETPKTLSALEQTAVKTFGNSTFASEPNSSGDYIIVSHNRKRIQDLFSTVEFFIFDNSNQTSIFQDTLPAGSVTWNSEHEILAIARNLRDQDGNRLPNISYFYNVISREKRSAQH